MDMPATGKSVDVQLIDIIRFGDDGLVYEHWGVIALCQRALPRSPSQAITTARDNLASIMTGLGATTNQIEVAAGGSAAKTLLIEADGCAAEIVHIAAGLDEGYAKAKAAYDEMVKKAKSLGW
jgi:hypothetical protein